MIEMLDVDELDHQLKELQGVVYDINFKNGWFDTSRTVLEDLMLIVTEVAEAAEEYREGNIKIGTTFDEKGKPLGFASEIADILIRLLDLCERHEIDLVKETIQKLDYNRTRGHRHGGKLA